MFELGDILTMTSGTISSLTGLDRYEDIDAIQHTFYFWAKSRVEQGCRFYSWHDCWNQFVLPHRCDCEPCSRQSRLCPASASSLLQDCQQTAKHDAQIASSC